VDGQLARRGYSVIRLRAPALMVEPRVIFIIPHGGDFGTGGILGRFLNIPGTLMVKGLPIKYTADLS